jgi:hypothetical protein
MKRHGLALTDGTIYSWGLRVAFLSNPNAAVAGCEVSCKHGNPNCYIVFVSAWPSFFSKLNISNINFLSVRNPCLSLFFSKYGRMLLRVLIFLGRGFKKTIKLHECWRVRRGKGKLFCNFSLVGGFCVNCKCACLFAVAWYTLRNLCFI